MAIKVNGTTVIDDSRNISNIAGGFKTVNGSSILGSGNIEAGGGTPEIWGNKTSGRVNTSSAAPVGGVFIFAANDSYLSSTYGSSSPLDNYAEWGRSYTMTGGTWTGGDNFIRIANTPTGSTDTSHNFTSGTYKFTTTAHASSYGGPAFLAVRVS